MSKKLIDKSTVAIRAVNDFGLSQAEAADLVKQSQPWVSRELQKHFEKAEGYEVVIAPDDGLDEEHARLMRERLLDDGFHDHAVEVREVEDDA